MRTDEDDSDERRQQRCRYDRMVETTAEPSAAGGEEELERGRAIIGLGDLDPFQRGE